MGKARGSQVFLAVSNGACRCGLEGVGEVNFLNLKFLNFRGIRKSRKFPLVDGLGVTGVPAYNTGHRERYLADGSRPPPRRS